MSKEICNAIVDLTNENRKLKEAGRAFYRMAKLFHRDSDDIWVAVKEEYLPILLGDDWDHDK